MFITLNPHVSRKPVMHVSPRCASSHLGEFRRVYPKAHPDLAYCLKCAVYRRMPYEYGYE